jgi:hypothetical protein
MKNPESNCIAEAVSQGSSMTWGESLQCRMVWVGVTQCPTGGWRNHQGTNKSIKHVRTKKKKKKIDRGCSPGLGFSYQAKKDLNNVIEPSF